ncbi:STAS domain-containing protein [Streptomyces sp. NPDC051913]|uniref:STAS domain-containing protein n=1 Tax=Streptomyces sp. NPDC051913 TaxID=3365676 RepID=UPI0037D2241C
MLLPPLAVYRHDRTSHTLITLAGEIDLATAPLVSAALAGCVRDGIHTVDVDLTAVTRCDADGLGAFLDASRLAGEAGTALQLHYPPTAVARMIEVSGTGFLLDGPHAARSSTHPGGGS